MNELVGYLTDKCCAAADQTCESVCAPRVTKSVRRKSAA
jgi:hypothetical protein